MNIVKLNNFLWSKLTSFYCKFYFLYIKKPLYNISYNSKGNKFKFEGYLKRGSVYISGRNNTLIVGKNVYLNNVKIQIIGNNNILKIHDNVKFYNGKLITIENENNILEIGKNSDFQGVSFIIREYDTKVTVGKDCMFSADIIVRNGDSHTIYNSENIKVNPAKDVNIQDRVWIGYGATILKGTIIGSDSIIGTQSVVTGIHIPQGTIAAGNPAKIIKQGFHWGREKTR